MHKTKRINCCACGEPFEAKNSSVKYCPKCRDKHGYKRPHVNQAYKL